jgi:hypothetical protein
MFFEVKTKYETLHDLYKVLIKTNYDSSNVKFKKYITKVTKAERA